MHCENDAGSYKQRSVSREDVQLRVLIDVSVSSTQPISIYVEMGVEVLAF